MQYSYGIIPVFQSGTGYQFLLIQHLAGHWSFPKGRAEPGETPPMTAARELREETGIMDVVLFPAFSAIETYSFQDTDVTIEKQVVYFLGKVETKKVTIQPQEIQRFRWVNYDEGLELITFPEAKDILKQANEHLKLENRNSEKTKWGN